MDAFHSRQTESQNSVKHSQNLEDKNSLGTLFQETEYAQASLLKDIQQAYDYRLLHHEYVEEGVKEAINLYRIADEQDQGSIYTEKGQEVDNSELDQLKSIVDRHLGGEDL